MRHNRPATRWVPPTQRSMRLSVAASVAPASTSSPRRLSSQLVDVVAPPALQRHVGIEGDAGVPMDQPVGPECEAVDHRIEAPVPHEDRRLHLAYHFEDVRRRQRSSAQRHQNLPFAATKPDPTAGSSSSSRRSAAPTCGSAGHPSTHSSSCSGVADRTACQARWASANCSGFTSGAASQSLVSWPSVSAAKYCRDCARCSRSASCGRAANQSSNCKQLQLVEQVVLEQQDDASIIRRRLQPAVALDEPLVRQPRQREALRGYPVGAPGGQRRQVDVGRDRPFEQDVQPGEMVVTNFSLAAAADDVIAVGDDELLSHLPLCGHRDC